MIGHTLKAFRAVYESVISYVKSGSITTGTKLAFAFLIPVRITDCDVYNCLFCFLIYLLKKRIVLFWAVFLSLCQKLLGALRLNV